MLVLDKKPTVLKLVEEIKNRYLGNKYYVAKYFFFRYCLEASQEFQSNVIQSV